MILNRSEAYLISCITALKHLEVEKKMEYVEKGQKESNTDKSTEVSLDFLAQCLLQEFPKTLWNAIKLIVLNLSGSRKSK